HASPCRGGRRSRSPSRSPRRSSGRSSSARRSPPFSSEGPRSSRPACSSSPRRPRLLSAALPASHALLRTVGEPRRMTAEAPRLPAPAKRRSPTALVAVLLALVLLALGALDVSRLAGGLPLPTQQRTSAQTEVTQRDAVKQTIQRSNEAQAGAFNSGDPSVMKRYATDSFYQELLKTNQDLAASGVTRIEIVSTEWGDIAVDGASARATTFETWRSTFRDGSSDESTARNDYALVSQDGAWKIDADDQPGAALRPQTDTGAPAAATRSSTSSNWPGYAARGGSFTSVTGTWTVPTVTATTSGADATWV